MVSDELPMDVESPPVAEPEPEPEPEPVAEPVAEPEPEAETPAVEEEVKPPLTRIHAAAPLGYVPTAEEINGEEFFIGFWNDKRNYGCPICTFSTLEGPGTVEFHILRKIDAGDSKHAEYYA